MVVVVALMLLAGGELSRPPVTYVLDYGKNHLDQAGYVAAVAGAPPDLLHLGKDGPFSHNWGPIRTTGGENQAHAKGADVERLSPAEVAARVARLQDLTAQLHRAGVRHILPYICLMTIGGHAERRTGFWEFYDHWDDYAAPFDLGPRPDDPAAWLQRSADGGLRRFYTYEGDFYPPYEPNHRYAVSLNAPGWRQWLCANVRQLARCGFDGAFVDNGGSEDSWDPTSLALFREWLARRYPAAQFAPLFGVAGPDQVQPVARPGGLLGVEWHRFRYTRIGEFLTLLGQEGSRVLGRRFLTFPNGAHHWGTIRYAHRDCDWTMFEESLGPSGTNTGYVSEPVAEDIRVRHYHRHAFRYLYTASVGGRVRALVLTRPGYPRSVKEFVMNPTAAELGMAEAAAYSGGGGYLLRPDWRGFGPQITRYSRFFREQAAVYTGLIPDGLVGVVADTDQQLWGQRQHLDVAAATFEALSARHVPVRLLTAEDCTAAGLAGLSGVVVPAVRYLSPAAVEALRQVAARVPVQVVGEPPSHDDLGRESAAVAELATTPGVRRVASPTQVSIEDAWRLLAPGQERREVRVTAWRDPAGGRRVLHLVNYQVRLGDQVDDVTELRRLTLRLPAAWRARTARLVSPDRAAPETWRVAADGSVDLPPLRIYQVIELRD